MSLLLLFFPCPCRKCLLDSSGPWKQIFCIPRCRKRIPVPGMRPFTFPHARKFWSLEPGCRSPSRGQNFMAWRNVKCLISGTGRLFRHLGMQKVTFQVPEEFSGIGECKQELWVAGKMSWYQQWDCQSLVKEFSDGKLKQKGFFHSVLHQNIAFCMSTING